jgi:hypothetical protein
MSSNVIQTIKQLKNNPSYAAACQDLIESILTLIHYQVEFKDAAVNKTNIHKSYVYHKTKYPEFSEYLHTLHNVETAQKHLQTETDRVSRELKEMDLLYQQSNLESLKTKFKQRYFQDINSYYSEVQQIRNEAANYEFEYLKLNEHVKDAIAETKTKIINLMILLDAETNQSISYILENFKRKFLLFDVLDLSIDTKLHYYKKNEILPDTITIGFK